MIVTFVVFTEYKKEFYRVQAGAIVTEKTS